MHASAPFSHLVLGILALTLGLLPLETLPAQTAEPTVGEKRFALEVQPIFRNRCWACHGEKPDAVEGGFDLRTRESMLRGGDAFGSQVLQPGNSADSHLLKILSREEEGYEMPPKEADRLSAEEIEAIRDWIDLGAPWPDAERIRSIYQDHAEGITWQTSGGLSQDWTDRKYQRADLWAYQPLAIDWQVDLKSSAQHPVDFFINGRLAESGLQPAQLASRQELIRRATFDLWGLPPTPAQVERFQQDPQDDQAAWADLVDRLLASPHYGEQAARHWLDVVRYADSSGFANDWIRPNAWRYRDYVIRAFNQDKPYDQFVREQLAGDELASQLPQSDPARDARAAELHIATGFLRMGPWEHTGMSVARVTRQQFLDDITDATGQVFLAHALQCCRCHDHKFDPVPTRDYYSIQAVFATTQFAEVETVWVPDENREGMEERRRLLDLKIKANQQLAAEIQKRNRQYIRQWFASQKLPYKTIAEAKQAGVASEQLPPAKFGWQADDFGQERVVRKWDRRLSWELDMFQPLAYTVYNGKTVVKNSNQGRLKKPADPLKSGYLATTTILGGGDLDSPGEPVKPDVLSAVGLPLEIPVTPGGRRLAFARWLTSSDNPLVPRVMANRIWQSHFGRGLAGNPNNFGATGKPPTHPRLLDWLATEFRNNGWSVKKLHKTIMLSETYRRSIHHDDWRSLKSVDPDNERYAVFEQRPLAAEEIRDAMLAVSGELNPTIGGIPARPDMNLEAALQPRMIMGTFAPAYVPDPLPRQRNRRSIYALKLRGQRDPFLELFNQPGPDQSCERRDQSLVPPQALTLLNSAETHDRALALAIRLLRETHSPNETIERLFQLAYGRPAMDAEVATALRAWKQLTEQESAIDYRPRRYPTSITRTANEENTGELFTFVEELFEYREYVPDPQPHEVDARTRGLANICLAVLNSNEFLFVD